jgi:hypothetical protein
MRNRAPILHEGDVVAEDARKRLNIPPPNESGLTGGLPIVQLHGARESD